MIQPTTIQEFESIYNDQYDEELLRCDRWIQWCEKQTPKDTHGMNFYQGMRSAMIFNNMKMEQLIRTLKAAQGAS